MIQKNRSFVGFAVSLLFHVSFVAFLYWSVQKDDDSANGFAADIISTHISMEMLAATVINEPEPEPVSEPEPVVEPELPKEAVADPTVKPEPPKELEKPKEPKKAKKQEKPKEKPKDKPNKPKKERKDLPKSDREVNSDSAINQQATTTGMVTTTNPNLVGKGASTNEINAYRSALRREIERHKRYPNRAKMMRKQGVVTISFHLSNAGAISHARIVKSSGSEELDNAALNAVNNARPIGPLPVGMANEVNVPVSFKITN